MGNFALVAERLVVDKILEIVAEATGKTKIYGDMAAAALFFTVVGLGFLIFAAYLWLRDNYQPDTAAALAGLIALGLALLMGLAMWVFNSRKKSIIKHVRHEIHDSVREGMESLNQILSDPVHANPKAAALAASVAGFVAGEKLL
jgi:hypothetical protein